MLNPIFRSTRLRAFFVCAAALLSFKASAAEDLTPVNPNQPKISPASNEGETALKRFRLPKGFKAELVAAEPLLANPVAFTIDEQGRFYVAETFRLHAGVTDIRGHMDWLDEELASKSVEERIALMKRHEGARIANYAKESDRIRLLEDTDGDGRLDKATVFSDGYNRIEDGLGAGLLARKGDVYFANIPGLYLLRDTNGNGKADVKKTLSHGYGVRVGFLGHDLHGLRIGPDGRLYFSIGDRGAHVPLPNGKAVENHEDGVVYRCNLDGSELEIFARGLRNPQELVFDEFGNLWTGDNNSDAGDPARWVYLVEGGDSGWRIGWQFLERPARGAWLTERLCYPAWDGQAAYLIPPVAIIGNGPSGLAYDPGIGLPERFQKHFFLCDFRGSTGSGVHAFAVKPKGAGFEVVDRSEFVWEVLVTDGDFGFDGCFYITDWVNGWNLPGKGRIYRIYDPEARANPVVAETKKLIAEGFEKRSVIELAQLLAHPDQRVRQEAQFALADRGEPSLKLFAELAAKGTNRLARLHAIWGLGQLGRTLAKREGSAPASRQAFEQLMPLLGDTDPEVRAQAARVLGDTAGRFDAYNALIKLLADTEARPKFFATLALAKSHHREVLPLLLAMLRTNHNQDRYLRHAGVLALAGCADAPTLANLAKDDSSAVRMAALLALRRLERAEIAAFLADSDPLIVAEAARAINDLPIPGALPQLAALLAQPDRLAALPAGDDPQRPGPRDAVLRRVVNAGFRLGDSANAGALATFAAYSSPPAAVRAEALNDLADWAAPSGRDAVTGLWRPLAKRDTAPAIAALQPRVAGLLADPAPAVKIATMRAAAKLGIREGNAAALALVSDGQQPANVRVEALKTLASLKSEKLDEALRLALADSSEALRKEANRLSAQLKPKDATAQIRATLEKGTLGEKQSALATLGELPDATADEVLAQWLDQSLARQVPAELQLDVLAAAAKRNTPALKDKLRQYEDARPATDDLRAYRECLVGGDAAEGEKVFLEKVEASCIRCHKAGGDGGEVGPNLAGIGSNKNREYILESIVFPNKQIAPGFESLIVTLNNGTAYAGLLKGETADTLELNSPEDGLLTLKKANIKTRERGLSAMPEELRQVITKQDLRNLVEFLSGVK